MHSAPIADIIFDKNDFAECLLNASDKLDSYCAADATANVSTVVDTTVTYHSPPQWAYRAHNPTDPSLSSASLSVQHPVAIKLEDLPCSPASDCAANVGEFCYFHSNNSPTSAPVNYYPAADPAILPGPEIVDEPRIIEIVEEEFVEESGANPVFEALTELPVAANQQPIRTLPALFPTRP